MKAKVTLVIIMTLLGVIFVSMGKTLMITPIDIFILIGILILLIWCGLQEYAITNIVKDMERLEQKQRERTEHSE